jgi:hypothetical protein
VVPQELPDVQLELAQVEQVLPLNLEGGGGGGANGGGGSAGCNGGGGGHLAAAAEVAAQVLQAVVTAAEAVLEEFGLSVGSKVK